MSAPASLAETRITIVGLGLMGGSLALALHGRCLALYGVENNHATLAEAQARRLVDQAAGSLRDLPAADLLILATPVRAILRLLAQLPALHSTPVIVLDLGSTKRHIMQAMQALPPEFDPLGGHPMCGKAAGGLAQAEANLYQGATFALTPLERTSSAAMHLVNELIAAIGARAYWLDAEAHDRQVAATSHLAYLTSSALAAAVPAEAAPLVGPGLRSAARLAATPTPMMLEVLETNRTAVLDALARFRCELESLEQALQCGDRTTLAAALDANATHQRLLFTATDAPALPAEAEPSENPALTHPAAEPAGETSVPARRLQALPGNFFAQIERRISQMQAGGAEIIRLDIGSPDLPPPPAVIAALAEDAAQAGAHGYQPHNGLPELRQAWAGYYQRLYGVTLNSETQVLPLLGSKEGIFHLSQALLNPGDVVLAPDPGYMTYSRGAWFAGAEYYPLPLRAENGFLPELERIPTAILKRARLLWLNYPNNPTGASAPLEFFAQAVAFAEQHHLLLCHDAAYAQVCFDGYQAPSLLQVPGAAERTVEFASLSKAYNMAGWRSAALLGQPQALRALMQMKTHLDSGGFRPLQRASIAALHTPPEWLAERNAVYRRRRDLVLRTLPRLGLQAVAPRGSLYVWAALPAAESSQHYVERALAGAGVSLAPGTVFGPGGEGYVRFAISTPDAELARAMQRLNAWAESRPAQNH